MTALVTADLHLSDNQRDSYRFQAMRTIRRVIKDRHIDLLIVLGDICEAKNNHSAELVNAVVTEFAKFAKLCPVITTKGNHDYESEDHPYWAFLRRIPGVTYVQTPTDAKNLPMPPHLKWGRVLFAPHTANYQKDWAGIDLSAYDLVFAHQTFSGAINESGHAMDGVPLKVFAPWTQIISGDVHAPQTIQDQLTYVGAPFTVDFGNDYKPRVLLIPDDGKKFQSIPIEGPQKRLIDAGENYKEAIAKCNPGDIVKIRFPFKPGGKSSWQTIKETIQQWGEKYQLKIEKIEPIIEKGVSRKVVRRGPKTDLELLDMYSRSRGIDKRLVQTGAFLMRKS